MFDAAQVLRFIEHTHGLFEQYDEVHFPIVGACLPPGAYHHACDNLGELWCVEVSRDDDRVIDEYWWRAGEVWLVVRCYQVVDWNGKGDESRTD